MRYPETPGLGSHASSHARITISLSAMQPALVLERDLPSTIKHRDASVDHALLPIATLSRVRPTWALTRLQRKQVDGAIVCIWGSARMHRDSRLA